MERVARVLCAKKIAKKAKNQAEQSKGAKQRTILDRSEFRPGARCLSTKRGAAGGRSTSIVPICGLLSHMCSNLSFYSPVLMESPRHTRGKKTREVFRRCSVR